MVNTPKYLLVQERMQEPLDARLRYWRLHGVPNNAMAKMISSETGVPLTGQTIADWFVRIDSSAA